MRRHAERLGIAHHVTEQLSLELSLPAVGQGVIGIECRSDDHRSHCWGIIRVDATLSCDGIRIEQG